MEVCRMIWTLLGFLMTVTLVNGFNLTILHTNDIHARIEEMNKYNGRCSSSDAAKEKCYGGMARLKTKIDELRGLYPISLLLDGGDQYQGTLFFHVYGGKIMSHFMNILGYDAMGLGNHEFDNGVSGLKPFLDNASFPVLSTNIDVSNTAGLSSVKKSVVVDVGGQKIGIIGYTTVATTIISRPGNVVFSDEVESIQSEVTKLEGQGVNKIIAVGHAGFSKDKEIAQKVRGLDIVVGGHSNTFLYNGEAPSNNDPVGSYPAVFDNVDGDKVLVVQDYAYGKYLGFLQVEFDDQGKVTSWNGNPVLLDKSVAKDSEVRQVIEAYLPEIERKKTEKVGQSFVTLDGTRESCRVHECNMGNLVTDAMVRQNLRYADSLEWNHVSIAIANSGGIRSSISKGPVTASDCLSVMPFKNTIDIVELTGKVLWKALEHSVSKWVKSGDLSGAFLQVSGLKVVYDMRREVGLRVVKVQVMCTTCLIPQYESLNLTKVYKVLIPSFMVSGGDGYSMIKDNLGTHIIGDLDSELMLDYIQQNSPITTALDSRIQFLESVEENRICADGSTTLQSSIMITLVCLLTTIISCYGNPASLR